MVAHGEFAHIEALNYCLHNMGKNMLNVYITPRLGLDNWNFSLDELCSSFWLLNIQKPVLY
jgi:hypothetical protein